VADAAGVAVTAGAAVGVVAGDAAASPVEVSVLVSVAVVVAAAGLLPLFLKSVAYQPLPFKAKLGAVTCFAYVSAPQVGQVVNGASAIFRITSFA
jgi:hypothetical protein